MHPLRIEANQHLKVSKSLQVNYVLRFSDTCTPATNIPTATKPTVTIIYWAFAVCHTLGSTLVADT